MKVVLRNKDYNPLETIEAEIFHDVFALHEKHGKWHVTHTLSGWTLHGVQGPFHKRESAVAYIEALAAGRILWFFENETQMYELNNSDMLKAVVDGARLMASMV